VLRAELQAVADFRRSFIVSARDKEFLVAQGAQADRIVVAPVAVSPDLLLRAPVKEEGESLCFMGKMDTVANEDAARSFCLGVFPLLRERRPGLRLMLVGANPGLALRRLGEIPGVTVTGWMHDPYSILERSTLAIAPMRVGAGMQNKVLEAMALRKAAVISPLAAEGIGATGNEHYVVAEGVQKTVTAILTLLDDPEQRRRLGNAAREWIVRHHSWDSLTALFAAEIAESLRA
jgi:hypothetical protein